MCNLIAPSYTVHRDVEVYGLEALLQIEIVSIKYTAGNVCLYSLSPHMARSPIHIRPLIFYWSA